MAIGRSRPAPLLRTPVGARLTVTRLWGQLNPLDRIAALTRSLASRQEASGSPTTVNDGMPAETCTSTETAFPWTPIRVADGTLASTTTLPVNELRGTVRRPPSVPEDRNARVGRCG